MVKIRYEIQFKHRIYGWVAAGNWPARTKKEGLESLKACADGINREGSVDDYRLVRLSPIVLAIRKATRKRDND